MEHSKNTASSKTGNNCKCCVVCRLDPTIFTTKQQRYNTTCRSQESLDSRPRCAETHRSAKAFGRTHVQLIFASWRGLRIGYRDYLLECRNKMLDQTQARLWFSHAERAINAGRYRSSKTASRQLWSLLPNNFRRGGYGDGTVRAMDMNI